MKVTTNGKLNITNRPLPQWLTLFVFMMPFFLAFLQELLGLPGVVKYTIDAAWVCATCLLFFRRKITLDKKMIPFFVFIGVFLLYTVLLYILNYQSVLYYLWGFRNNFRFYFAFILFFMLLFEEEAEFCLKFMDILFYINAVVAFFQFYVLGYKWDYLGGIFGVQVGCNAPSMIFLTIVVSRSILLYMDKKEKLWVCVLKCALSLVIAAMSELKFYFVVFAVVLLMASLLTKFTWQKFLLIIVSGAIIMIAGSLLTVFFGESSQLSLERLWELATTETYATGEDLSRASAIPTISNTILTSIPDKLFGMGLGNCDNSNFAVVNTPFYQMYSDLHYTWFSSAFLFLEVGYVGLTMYVLFFAMCFVFAHRMYRTGKANRLYCQMAMIASVFCVMLTIYNCSLRLEVAYMIYFVLALPLISSKADIEYERRLNVHK